MGNRIWGWAETVRYDEFNHRFNRKNPSVNICYIAVLFETENSWTLTGRRAVYAGY